jgi:coenzyme F420-reducing hydrogenase alpha subunit
VPEILIDPVTRIYGNAAVRIEASGDGEPGEARFQAYGYRGLDQAVRGAHLDNLMPIVSRICGADSLFHQIGAATAAEKALDMDLPEAALRLRELALWAQLFERHAVSLTVHSLPDLLFPSSGQNLRSIIGIHKVDEEVVQRVMALKSLGTAILREAGGRAVHPVNFIIGGAIHDIGDERRSELLQRLEEAKPLLVETCHLMKLLLRRNEEVAKGLGTEASSYLALEAETPVALTGTRGKIVGVEGKDEGKVETQDMPARFVENNSSYSHIRHVEIQGITRFRVGPLARLNINGKYGSETADEELEDVKEQWGFPVHQSMLAHMARMLEMMHAWERMKALLSQPAGEVTRTPISYRAGEGVGAMDAPEGLLVYRLEVDGEGLIREMNFIAPLQFNLKALEGSLNETAAAFAGPNDAVERAVGYLEMAVRAYAPCPMCGLH